MQDSRVIEKEIAPHISQEIDGRNFVRYKFGHVASFEIDSFEFDFATFNSSKFYSKKFLFPLIPVIKNSTRIALTVTADKKEDVIWSVFLENAVLQTFEISVSKTPKTVFFDTVLPFGEFLLEQIIDKSDDLNLIVSGKIITEFSYPFKKITASNLGTSLFYIERIILKEGDAVSLDSFGSIFESDGKEKDIIFSVPIACRSISFLSGNPEIFIYWIKGLQ